MMGASLALRHRGWILRYLTSSIARRYSGAIALSRSVAGRTISGCQAWSSMNIWALLVGRRALDEIINLAKSKHRGYAKQVSLADRQVFQRAIAEADLRLRAARSLMFDVFERAWQTVCSGRSPQPEQQAEMRSAATFATDVALEVTSMALRYGGGSTVWLDSVLQRCLRDLYVGASHLMVSDTAYEHYGQALLDLPEVDPMG